MRLYLVRIHVPLSIFIPLLIFRSANEDLCNPKDSKSISIGLTALLRAEEGKRFSWSGKSGSRKELEECFMIVSG